MKRLRTVQLGGVKISQLIEEFDRVGSLFLEPIPDGSGRSRGPDTEDGWISGLRNAWIVTSDRWGLGEFPMLSVAVMNLSMSRGNGEARRVEGVMLNELAPGSKLDTHRDGPPHHERWHLPIRTNPAVRYWEEKLDEPVHLPLGIWSGPIDHSSRHFMVNDGLESRVHVVVDLEKPES